MNNQEILIIILIIVLFVLKFYKLSENFDVNNISCTSNPLNSNCSCPPVAPSQIVFGKFPMNYSQTSPYLYSCVSNDIQEPSTNVYPNPPE
jgi:hypothetical protein